MHFNVRTSDRLILSYGEPAGTPPNGAESIDVTGALLAQIMVAFQTPNGGLQLALDGTLTALPVPPPDPVLVALMLERSTATSDLATQFAAAMTRLDDIVLNGPTYTQAQARDAIVDLARILRRTLRLTKAVLT